MLKGLEFATTIAALPPSCRKHDFPALPRVQRPRVPVGERGIAATELRGSEMTKCPARRRIVSDYDDGGGEEGKEFEHNEQISMLETYSQTARNEALLVQAIVDGRQEEILIFKGFSSSLSYGTSPDPSRSILPARAIIKSIQRIKGPFDPSNIEYIERDLTLEDFNNRFH